jgi:holo-[acyl-carrier protein] synthase
VNFHGIGLDIIEIERMEQALRRTPRIAERCFTPAERTYCQSRGRAAMHFAGRFAAKEAIAKAVGHPLVWQEVEVGRSRRGRPVVSLLGGTRDALAGRKLLVSITHTIHYAAACAVLVDDAVEGETA